MSRQLIVIAGPDVGKTFSLADGQTLVIGRGQASHTQLADPATSRVHCRVQVDEPRRFCSMRGEPAVRGRGRPSFHSGRA